MTHLLWHFLAWDYAIQGVGSVLAFAGLMVSVWLTSEAWQDWLAVRQNGEVEQIVARSHLRSQMVILFLQVLFLIVNLMVVTLPPIPEHPPWVLVVMFTRKIARNVIIVLLLYAAVKQAMDRRRMLGLLRGAVA